MQTDDNDKLWELLGKRRQPPVSPFFARNVLRAVRQEQASRPVRSAIRSFFARVHRASWQVAVGGTCVIALLITLAPGSLLRHHHSREERPAVARQIVGNPDYEVIKHLDELVADEESSLWLDDPVN